MLLRLLRISDDPRRIALGVFVGTFVAFTPFFGAHFLLAPVLAWAIGGNVLASLSATMICNPITFPAIAYSAIKLGNWILQTGNPVDKAAIEDAFESIWRTAISSPESDSDLGAAALFEQVFLPYLTGGSLIGLAAGSVAAWFSVRAVRSYRKLRRRRAARKKGIIDDAV